jgi:hypothetical protein
VETGRRVIALKRLDVCCMCGRELPSGFRALWDFYARTITCLECAGRDAVLESVMAAEDR